MLVGLGVIAGRTRRHIGLDHAGGQRLGKFGCLHRHRLRADQVSDLGGRGAVGAPFDLAHIGYRTDFLLGVEPLRRPGHGIEHHHSLLAKLLVEGRLLCLIKLEGLLVAGGQEGNAIQPIDRPFVFEVDQQHFAQLRLTRLHRPLDLGGLEERGIRMDRDLEFAAARLLDVIGELHQIFSVEVAGSIGCGQIPFGLRPR